MVIYKNKILISLSLVNAEKALKIFSAVFFHAKYYTQFDIDLNVFCPINFSYLFFPKNNFKRNNVMTIELNLLSY